MFCLVKKKKHKSQELPVQKIPVFNSMCRCDVLRWMLLQWQCVNSRPEDWCHIVMKQFLAVAEVLIKEGWWFVFILREMCCFIISFLSFTDLSFFQMATEMNLKCIPNKSQPLYLNWLLVFLKSSCYSSGFTKILEMIIGNGV